MHRTTSQGRGASTVPLTYRHHLVVLRPWRGLLFFQLKLRYHSAVIKSTDFLRADDELHTTSSIDPFVVWVSSRIYINKIKWLQVSWYRKIFVKQSQTLNDFLIASTFASSVLLVEFRRSTYTISLYLELACTTHKTDNKILPRFGQRFDVCRIIDSVFVERPDCPSTYAVPYPEMSRATVRVPQLTQRKTTLIILPKSSLLSLCVPVHLCVCVPLCWEP